METAKELVGNAYAAKTEDDKNTLALESAKKLKTIKGKIHDLAIGMQQKGRDNTMALKTEDEVEKIIKDLYADVLGVVL